MLADTLSHAALTTTSTLTTVHHVNALKHIPISDMRLEELRCATEKDNVVNYVVAYLNKVNVQRNKF